jgi:hypothetical protein
MPTAADDGEPEHQGTYYPQPQDDPIERQSSQPIRGARAGFRPGRTSSQLRPYVVI